jgi:hypothetical protein
MLDLFSIVQSRPIIIPRAAAVCYRAFAPARRMHGLCFDVFSAAAPPLAPDTA